MTESAKQFEGLLDRYFESLLLQEPITATFTGLTSGEGQLPAATPAFVQRRERQRQAALRELEAINPRELSNDQHLDRLAWRSLLLRECEDFARGRHTREPNAPEQLFTILLHELQRSEDEPARGAGNVRSLLRQTPRFLEQASRLLQQPERVWVNVLRQTLAGAPPLLQAVADLLGRVRPRPDDGTAVRSVVTALQRYRDRVGERPLAPVNSFALGAAGLQRRVQDELGLDYTLGQIEQLALGEVRRVGGLLAKACAARGGRGRPETVLAAVRARWRPPQDLVPLYQEQTRQVADAFRAARAVTFPRGDELEIRPVPEFLRALIPIAAYNAPGAFAKRQRGIFWVNDLGATRTTAKDQLAEQQQHFGLPLTCAHEAYPGHHLQFVRANQHPRKWRRLFAHAVFYEGWTLWCEQMAVDLRVDGSPWLRVQQLHDALWRCHRILVDLRLQTGRYSHSQAVRHLCRALGWTPARAAADVNWYTAQPGVPMSYWLGRLENERLYTRLVTGHGWSLRRFNDWLLSFGTLPQSWIEKYGLDA